MGFHALIRTELKSYESAQKRGRSVVNKKLLSQVPARAGKPPYYVVVDEAVVGIVSKAGKFTPYPYGFGLEDIEIGDFDFVFSTMAFPSMLRLLPVDSGMEHPLEPDIATRHEHLLMLSKVTASKLEKGLDEAFEFIKDRLNSFLVRKLAREPMVNVSSILEANEVKGVSTKKVVNDLIGDVADHKVMMLMMAVSALNIEMDSIWEAVKNLQNGDGESDDQSEDAE